MVQRFDYLVISSGIAGISFALKVANERQERSTYL